MEKGSDQVVYVDYENISKVLKAGNRVFVDDGLISLIVSTVSKYHSCTSLSSSLPLLPVHACVKLIIIKMIFSIFDIFFSLEYLKIVVTLKINKTRMLLECIFFI